MFKEEDLIELNSRFYTNCKTTFKNFHTTYCAYFIIYFGYFMLFWVLPLKVEDTQRYFDWCNIFYISIFIRHNAYFVVCKFRTLYADFTNSFTWLYKQSFNNCSNFKSKMEV